MDYKDYYSIVGINKTATQDEIKRAYRKKAAQYHPDKNPNDKVAEKNFTDLQEAYEVLKDPEKRKLYDQVGLNWKQYQNMGAGNPFGGQGFSGGGSSQFSDFFETIFGGGAGGFGNAQQRGGFGGGFHQAESKPKTIELELEVSLEDIYHGTEKSVTIQNETVKVKIPKGIEDGKKLKLKGRGPQGSDILLSIKTRLTSTLERKGSDIIQTVLIPVWDALLGTTVSVKTLKGELSVKIPELSKPESTLRLKGFGLPLFHHTEQFGDVYIKVKYALPEALTDMQKMLIKELKN